MAIDFTKFGDGVQPNEEGSFNKYWWKEKTEESMAQSIAAVVRTIADFDGRRQNQYQISTRLYGNSDIMGINGMSFAKASTNQNTMRDRISYNVIQSAIDTVTAKIGKNRPKPLFLTSGGDWEIQRKAQKLTKFVEGIFYENHVREMGPMAFRDACVFGDGFVHVFPENGRVKYERVIPSELYVDWVDGFYGKPRQIHRVKNVDRQVLMEAFPKSRKAIADANGATASMQGAYQRVTDQVTVVESFRLPSPGKEDGLHVISIENNVLFKEQWVKDKFPYARMSWSKRLMGYFSQGGAEQIQNIQLEINKLLWVIQRSMHLAGSFKIFLENSSKIVKEHLSNDIGSIISYTGQQPTYLVPPIVPPEVYSHLMTLKNAAYEQFGISQLSASSQKPAGLNSGKALREYNDIESERFMTIGQAYENFHLELADLTVMVAKGIYEEDKSFSVNVPGKKFIETIQWKKVDMEDDEFIMKVFPISSLPSDPEGRLQTVQEYVQAGYYSPRTAKKLLDFPDTEAVDDLESAEEDYLHGILEKIVEEDVFTSPDPYDNLQLAQELSLEYIAQGKRDNLPEDKMENLRLFNEQVKELMQKSMPPPAPIAGPAPQANPMPAPTSDLIPNVNGVA